MGRKVITILLATIVFICSFLLTFTLCQGTPAAEDNSASGVAGARVINQVEDMANEYNQNLIELEKELEGMDDL